MSEEAFRAPEGARRTASGSRGRRGAWSISSTTSIAAISALVVVVSLPRMRSLALRENVRDAHHLVEVLGEALESTAAETRPADLALDLLAREARLERRLEDAEYLEGGLLLRRHGYLFQAVGGTGSALPAVRAWPWAHGRTGTIVLVRAPDGSVYRHANADARWSGPQSPPPLPWSEGGDRTGWQRLGAAPSTEG